MTIENFYKKQLEENEQNIAIDFDGVIHSNSKGFFDGSVYDAPVDGTLDAIKFLSQYFNIIIFTCKVKEDRPLVEGKTGLELIREWLKKYNLLEYVTDITCEKPRALFYIDDKAIEFKDWDSCINFLKNFLKNKA